MAHIGLDLGGTKIAVAVFGDDWRVKETRRIETPGDYATLLGALAKLLDWAHDLAPDAVSVGVATAGVINRTTGTVQAANLPLQDHHLAADLVKATGRKVSVINDAQALALSEAKLGAGRGYSSVFCLSLGTGISGALILDGQIQTGWSGAAGEIGHISAPAALVQKHDLPILPCGCGRAGCAETFLSGPGLSQIALAKTGKTLSAPEIIEGRSNDPDLAGVWEIWCELAGDMVRTLTRTHDTACFVLAGGLSAIPGIASDFKKVAKANQFPNLPIAPCVLAEGGAFSVARGAALFALQNEGCND